MDLELIRWQKDRAKEAAESAREDSPSIDLNAEGRLMVDSLLELGFTEEQVKLVLALRSNICKECNDDFTGCRCWDDS